MKLLVTGAGGMLAADVTRAAHAAGHEVVALDRERLDVTDAWAAASRLDHERPEAVVNCAAYTDVDGAESEPRAATDANAEGAEVIAAAAAAVGAAVVYPSTDYVFDGATARPYVESDEPRPMSAYGQSKLAGERATAIANPHHFVARSAWLFGAGGPNFVATMLRLGSERDEVTVVSDQVGSPTYTGHLAGALVDLLETERYGTHHVAGAGECSWHELATETFRRAGIDCRVREGATAELSRPAARPAYSALASERADTPRLPPWEEGLAAFLAERPGAQP